MSKATNIVLGLGTLAAAVGTNPSVDVTNDTTAVIDSAHVQVVDLPKVNFNLVAVAKAQTTSPRPLVTTCPPGTGLQGTGVGTTCVPGPGVTPQPPVTPPPGTTPRDCTGPGACPPPPPLPPVPPVTPPTVQPPTVTPPTTGGPITVSPVVNGGSTTVTSAVTSTNTLTGNNTNTNTANGGAGGSATSNAQGGAGGQGGNAQTGAVTVNSGNSYEAQRIVTPASAPTTILNGAMCVDQRVNPSLAAGWMGGTVTVGGGGRSATNMNCVTTVAESNETIARIQAGALTATAQDGLAGCFSRTMTSMAALPEDMRMTREEVMRICNAAVVAPVAQVVVAPPEPVVPVFAAPPPPPPPSDAVGRVSAPPAAPVARIG